MGRDNSALAKNTCAANTKAAANSRDCRKKASCCPAAEVRKNARRWNSSGDCRCSWARRSCCFPAGRHCLPTVDDRS